jgi:hypothetical protein
MDLISRMQSGEDVTESPLPDTKAGTLDISRYMNLASRLSRLFAPIAVPTHRPLTLLEYFVKHGDVVATAKSIAPAVYTAQEDDEQHSTAFLADLETYKAD